MAVRGYGRSSRGSSRRWPVFGGSGKVIVNQGRDQRQETQEEGQPRRSRRTTKQASGQGGTEMANGNQNRTQTQQKPGVWDNPFMPQGTLTGTLDMAYFMGSTAGFTIWNKIRAQQDKRDDLGWAIGEILLGTLFAMSLAESVTIEVAGDRETDPRRRRRRQTFEASGPSTLLNISLGAAAAGMTYILNGRAKSK